MLKTLTAFSFLLLLGCNRAPGVEVDGEILLGKYVEDGTVAAFFGVPFAEPPTGDLRWRSPQPLKNTVDHRTVVDFAAACMQTMRILDWYRYMAETFGGSRDYYRDLEISEDCLYLNVWTPTLKHDASLPVMVWVHGGSNRSGWSYEPNYHGHKLARKGVVVVSVAYRVGAFGFLSHAEIPPEDAVANFGLWDLIASLQWVQQNIAKFGGDPGRVTMFGESSGAENILALMFAASADGLFHRAILESTAGYGLRRSPSLADEQKRGHNLAGIMGFEGDDSIASLRLVPADKLLQAYEEAFPDYYHSPAVDGQLLLRPTWEEIQAGSFTDRQLIIGTNAAEWYDFLDADSTRDDVLSAADKLRYIDSAGALAAVISETDPRRAMDRLITAENYVCPSQNTAAKMTAVGRDAWMYYFTRVREDPGGAKVRAFHGAEYAYAFGTHDAYMRTTDVDLELTESMMGYWTQFAATGNPNAEGLPEWLLFKAPDFPVQELGDDIFTIAAPEPMLCDLFERSIGEPVVAP